MVLLNNQVPINGKEGVVTVVIDGNVREWAAIKTLTATVTINDETWNALGDRATRHKPAGWSGAGTVTYHYIDNIITKAILQYVRTGRYPEITIVTTNNAPESAVGEQSIKLGAVMISTADIAKLDVGSNALEGSSSITFSEIEGLEIFSDL